MKIFSLTKDQRPPIFTSEKNGNDQDGDGSEEKPFKTVIQAMRCAKSEPFPDIMVDGKDENNVCPRFCCNKEYFCSFIVKPIAMSYFDNSLQSSRDFSYIYCTFCLLFTSFAEI